MLEPIPVFRDSAEDLRDFFVDLENSLIKIRKERSTRKQYKFPTTNGEAVVDSWKFNEFAYGTDIELPSQARGLFTRDGKIIARGYDKFFNVGEVEKSKLEHLQKLKGPFALTMKENGCIVFLSGLEDGTLVVCSKHVTGEPVIESDGKGSRHYERAKKTVYEHLEKAGKSAEELATFLYKHNITAVAELCDDDFEEHIIEYPKELAGLYLHGINANTIQFHSYPMKNVYAVADYFGFKRVYYEQYDSFDTLWSFLEEKSKTAKVQLILEQRKHARIVQAYLDFVEKLFSEQPELAEQFLEEKGIIKVRKMFLKDIGLDQQDGMGLVALNESEKLTKRFNEFFEEVKFRYILFPIAVVGCGKTTVFRTLANLFPKWQHFQNDNYSAPKEFRNSCVKSLADSPLLLLDRNNSSRKERQSLIDDIFQMRCNVLVPNVGLRFVGINFTACDDKEKFSKVIRERIDARGDNHQCVNAKTEKQKTERIILSMEARLQPPTLVASAPKNKVVNGEDLESPDDLFYSMINFDITKSSSLEIAKEIWAYLSQLQQFKDERDPTEEEWQRAYQEALDYKPTFKKVVSSKNLGDKRPEYYGVRIEDVSGLIDGVSTKLGEQKMWQSMRANDRVQKELHVTIGHKNSIYAFPSLKDKWNELARRFAMQVAKKESKEDKFVPVKFFCDVQVKKLVVFDNKLVTLSVQIPQTYKKEGENIILQNPALEPLNEHLHITVGTVSSSVSNADSNVLLHELSKNTVTS
ncbi:hypothetical protein CJJ09_004888 [Candidozyma auris]|nr:hypothetical protein CJJ09_004888 [[Candida] auris]